ncbi:DNA repair protein RecO [Persephonella sp.]
MADLLKDEAVVLRKSLSADYDLSITVFLKKYGKENIYIKNGQKLKSPFITATEPFSWFRGVFIKRKEKFFIKEIDRKVPLGLKISSSADTFKTACEITNTFNRYVIFPDEKAFILLKKTLYYLTERKIPDTLLKLNFLTKLVYVLGIFPELDLCVRCSSKVNSANYGILSSTEGGVVCTTCSKQKTNIPFHTVKELKNLKVVNFKNLPKLNISSSYTAERFLMEHLQKNL